VESFEAETAIIESVCAPPVILPCFAWQLFYKIGPQIR
jgi:hypothetical protein